MSEVDRLLDQSRRIVYPWLRGLQPTHSVLNKDLEPDPDEDEVRQYLGERPLAWALEVADAAATAAFRREPRFAVKPATMALIRRGARSNCIRLLLGLAYDQPRSLVTPDTKLLARHLIASQIPLSAVQAGLRVSELVYTERLIDAVQGMGDSTARADETGHVALAVMRSFDDFLAEAGQIYEQESDRATVGKAAVTRELVMRILAGESLDPTAASEMLGYNLSGSHVAVVLSGPVRASRRAKSVSIRSADLQQVTSSLLNRLRPPANLCVPVGAGEMWMWCALPNVDLDVVTAIDSPLNGVRCSIGRPADGISGFRFSHMQAQEASRFASAYAADSWVTAWELVGLDALLSTNSELASQFVLDELGELASEQPEMRDLRNTLASYLRHGRGLVRPARELYVNRNTVSYRIAKVERLLGHPVANRIPELQAALRLHSVFRGRPVGERMGDSPDQ